MKALHLLLAFSFVALFSYGQYCGNSGPSVCTATGNPQGDGFVDMNQVPCIVQNSLYNEPIPFTTYTTINLSGLQQLDSLEFVTISNLPAGLCWATNKANNRFVPQETGCLNISGTTAAAAGQYKLLITLKVWANGYVTGINSPPSLCDQMNIKIYLRVVTPATVSCPLVDTSQTGLMISFDSVAQVSGTVFYDLNQNSTFDVTDAPVRNSLVWLNNGSLGLTNSAGQYFLYTVPGNYTLSPDSNLTSVGFSVNPASININASAAGSGYPNNNFAVVVPPNLCAGELSVVANNPPPRPGFQNSVYIIFHNSVSANPVTQTIRLSYPAQQWYVSASEVPSLVDTVARIIEWQTGNVNMGGQWQTSVQFQTPAPPAVALGTILQYSAAVVNSTCSSLNTLQTRTETEVVGSFDPNDKAVSPVGAENNHAVHPNTILTYTVRFQNTGNFLAEKVVIVDTISQHLNLATLKVKAASHPYEVAIDNSNRAVKFIFDQIMLPDSFSNEPGSHGYIQYSIQPNSNYTNGSIVTNRADIYFDFNPPILTNVVYNTLDDNISSIGSVSDVARFSVFPNPFNERLEVRTEITEAGNELLEIFDVRGRRIYSEKVTAPSFSISTAQWQAGVYLVKLGHAVKRVVKE